MEKLFVIKIGGNVIDEEKTFFSFLDDFASIRERKILVHGGGKIATRLGEKLAIESNYVNGRRITNAAALDLVTMVYGGLINKKIVARLQSAGCNAIGLTGVDANLIPATKRTVKDVDFGFVGDIKKEGVNASFLAILLDQGITPAIAPLTHDGHGQILNTNADTIASALAVGLSDRYEVRLIYCFEKKGVFLNIDDENSVIPFITKESYRQLLKDKKLFDGILPKIDNAFDAIEHGVKEVLVGQASELLQNLGEAPGGTLFK